jgi:hypothetical protein
MDKFISGIVGAGKFLWGLIRIAIILTVGAFLLHQWGNIGLNLVENVLFAVLVLFSGVVIFGLLYEAWK